MGQDGKAVLKIITYISPAIPLDYIETVAQYLEEKLDIETFIINETRWSGPHPKRVDPFQAEICDIGFTCSTSYLRYLNEGAGFVELIGAGPVHRHPYADGRPVYYSEIIVNENNKGMFKEFSDLKGSRWTYNDAESITGNILPLMKLKDSGENASFFGTVIQSGSHLASIDMVLHGQVDAAAIDSNVLAIYKARNPNNGEQLKVIETMGPSPVYPLLARKTLSSEIKLSIREALLSVHHDMKWKPKFDKYFVDKFVPIDNSLYSLETNLRQMVKDLSIHPAFY